jgi:mono/diheme cytochrome c family protein
MRRLLSLTALVVAAISGCRGGDSELPPVHLIHNMDTQEKVKAYRKDIAGIFSDGRGMRAPPEGTVAQGQLDEDDLYYRGVDAKGEPSKVLPAQLKNPDGTVPEKVVRRGENRYAIYCAPCHGLAGDGKGPVASRGLEIPPANLHDEFRKTMAVGKLYAAIAAGVNNGNMASYASQIPVADRWAIVAYICELQQVSCEDRKVIVIDPNEVSVKKGEQLYKARACVTCHSIDGTKLVGPTFKGVWGKTEPTSAGDVVVDAAYVKESILNPTAKVTTGYPPAMPPQALPDAEIDSIILYLQTLK